LIDELGGQNRLVALTAPQKKPDEKKPRAEHRCGVDVVSDVGYLMKLKEPD